MTPAQDATALADKLEPQIFDGFSKRSAVAFAEEIIQQGDAYGSAAKHSTTIGTRNAIQGLLTYIEALKRVRATSQPPDAVLEAAADAIDAARYAHPDHPRERPRSFAEADRSDREYAVRLARAAFSTPSASAGPQAEAVAWRAKFKGDSTWTLYYSDPKELLTEEPPLFYEPLYAHPQPQQADAIAWLCEYDGHTDATTDPDTVRIWRDTLGRKITPLGPQQADGRGAVIEALRESLQIIADWQNVRIADEHEHSLRDIIRSITDCADRALQQSPATDNAPETK